MRLSALGEIHCGCAAGVYPIHVSLTIITLVQNDALAGRNNSTREDIEEDPRWNIYTLI